MFSQLPACWGQVKKLTATNIRPRRPLLGVADNLLVIGIALMAIWICLACTLA